MKHPVSYLSQLKFDPKLRDKWYAKYITQIRLVMMLILGIVVLGIFGYLNLPRRQNPEINIPIVIVQTVLPGASPEDVESLVTIPLEDKINSVEGIDTMTSSSVENSSTINIQFESNINGANARDDVQSAVDSVNNLPTDALDPSVIKLDFENQPIWNFALITDLDYPSLMRFSKHLKDRIEALSVVDRVTLSGFDTEGVEVVILPEKIKEYELSPVQISQALKVAASSYPAGNIKTEASAFVLTIDKDITTLDDIRNLRLSIAEKDIRLGEIAEVAFRSVPGQAITYYASNSVPTKPSVQFFVYKTSTTNIDDAQAEVQAVVDLVLKEQNDKFELVNIINAAEEIVKQFSDLTQDFFFTVILVFILLLIFLGFRQAIISSITVPLTFLSTFAIINALGLSLNFLTMFAFLIALGLLIDDTIVTVAAMTRYFATGKFTPAQTGVLVWRDFIVPLWSTTITTIWAFVPLLIASGIIGEFIKSIPIVVTATMLSSTTIAVLVTLPLMIVFLKPQFPKRIKILLTVLGILILTIPLFIFIPKNFVIVILLLTVGLFLLVGLRVRTKLLISFQKYIRSHKFTNFGVTYLGKITGRGVIDIEVLSRHYMRVIERILISRHGKRNVLIALGVFSLLAYLLVPLGFVKNEFFPKVDADILYVTVDLSPGTTIEKINAEAINLLERVKKEPEVNFVIAEAGAAFNGEQGRASGGSSFLLTLHLTSHESRNIPSYDIAQNLRQDLKDYNLGKLTVQELSGGPPAGSDIQISLLGEDSAVLDNLANQTVTFLESTEGVTNVNKSIKPGISKIVFVPDPEKLIESGLTTDSIGLWLRTYASGFSLDKIKFEGEEKDVIFRMTEDNQSPESLGTLNIPTSRGESVPFLSLGKLSLATNPTIITREDKKRTIGISAALVPGYNLQEKNQALENYVKNDLKLPSGYSYKAGGVNEENQKSVNSIMQAMLVSFLLILITMVIEFRSFRQTFIALAIIPMAVAGVFYIFALTQTPLSFPALIGVLALFGIVVTHAIVVIEKINDNIREHLPLKEAIIDAAGSRLEPVMLTSLATIVGLIPITLSDPLWRGLGGAIIAGLIFSGAIKLFFIPVTYYLMFKEKTI